MVYYYYITLIELQVGGMCTVIANNFDFRSSNLNSRLLKQGFDFTRLPCGFRGCCCGGGWTSNQVYILCNFQLKRPFCHGHDNLIVPKAWIGPIRVLKATHHEISN